jgi:hypothetical protein
MGPQLALQNLGMSQNTRSMSPLSLPKRIALVLGVLGVSMVSGPDAVAEPDFGQFDIQTTFYISKSDDRNRVDYGIRLDQRCAPAKDDAVFPYWREFENSPPVRTHSLGMFEYVGYGFAEQRTVKKLPNGGIHILKLKQWDKSPIAIITRKEADGHCSSEVHAMIAGKESELVYLYVKLAKGGLTPSVDYVDVHGKDLETKADITDRMKR